MVAAVCATYNSPFAAYLRDYGANDYDAGFVLISWIALGILACVSRGGGGTAAAAAAKKGGVPAGAAKKKKK